MSIEIPFCDNIVDYAKNECSIWGSVHQLKHTVITGVKLESQMDNFEYRSVSLLLLSQLALLYYIL
ncbi:hypothetical protein M569_17190 [Genlisea aurea]|uniref:Uncharacterized protein n=1 Tax=Genlisea aurea TaxID=192259 RepID=S8DE26_9LAMI|nr:hypothetical protein M569_17190 [Genlisea aurea]